MLGPQPDPLPPPNDTSTEKYRQFCRGVIREIRATFDLDAGAGPPPPQNDTSTEKDLRSFPVEVSFLGASAPDGRIPSPPSTNDTASVILTFGTGSLVCECHSVRFDTISIAPPASPTAFPHAKVSRTAFPLFQLFCEIIIHEFIIIIMHSLII